MPSWERLSVAGGVLLIALLAAKLIDRRIARRDLPPEVATRYRVVRRGVMTAIVAIGLLSGLLVIPQVRAVAGGILASSAVLGLVIGFASQRTIGNFVAGLLIAFTQPLRLGDRVEIDGVQGVVEEIALTYTFIRASDNSRLVIPNEKLASDTIRNSTIVSSDKLAEVTVQIPLEHDLRAVVDALRDETAAERDAEVFVSALDGEATVTLRAWAADELSAQRLESDLRVRAHGRLREAGIYA
ncbi:MAG: mechanosensitive ion channel [Actinobacteria bacterium]|nr:mechanosensitive ion channel [Actinomycetota bacterium]